MKTTIDCIPCFVNQTISTCRMFKMEEKKIKIVLNKVLKKLSEFEYDITPPYVGMFVHRIIRESLNNSDPYKEIKYKYNNDVLQKYDKLKNIIDKSNDRILTAVRLAIAGNIIDFGAVHNHLDFDIDEAIIQTSARNIRKPDHWDYDDFINDIQKAKKILYLGDNCGEIVFDKLLIEELPKEIITYVVRGKPILNDITIEDAKFVGLESIVKIIDTGSDAPGIIFDYCSSQFKEEFENTDLIISKGQGNYETLNNLNKNIYFLLKIKCPVIAKHIGHRVGEIVFLKNKI